AALLYLHSFPTRRSSDLAGAPSPKSVTSSRTTAVWYHCRRQRSLTRASASRALRASFSRTSGSRLSTGAGRALVSISPVCTGAQAATAPRTRTDAACRNTRGAPRRRCSEVLPSLCLVMVRSPAHNLARGTDFRARLRECCTSQRAGRPGLHAMEPAAVPLCVMTRESPGTSGGGRPAIVLLSGGLDSVTVLAGAVHEGWNVHALSFRYGQRHAHELDLARRAARRYGATEHRIAEIDLRAFGGSALTANMEVPRDRDESEMSERIPITYVPARNTIFLSYALAWAEVAGASDIFIGVNSLDYSGYPDCRPEFIEAFEKLAN